MKILYFDCFSGISGDMVLGAFVDMGIDQAWLISELDKLNLDEFAIQVSNVMKNGIAATKLDVILLEEKHVEHQHGHHHRTLKDIIVLIDASGISEGAKSIARAIFNRLARAEARVHDAKPEDVHFHEVGAVDSIVDIAGCAICIDKLRPDKIFASPLRDGRGFIRCQHGSIPVPVPAVCELVQERNISLQTCEIEGEMITPTGAAILCELAEEFIPMPSIQLISKGYGAGTKDFKIPNLLRVFMGEKGGSENKIWLIETNLDDITPEALGFTMEQLFEAGALDVFYTPIYMKKNRPAYKLSVLCNDYEPFEALIFRHTTTLGVRRQQMERTTAMRQIVEMPQGGKLKVWKIGDIQKHAPEYESVAQIARSSGRSFGEIYDEMMRYGYETLYHKQK